MKTIIGIMLVSIMGFLGCSGSDAGTSAVTVQAFGLMDENGLSFTAHVMDQEGNRLSDAMLTINGEPMNIGFFDAEDVNMDQDGDLPDAIDPSAKGEKCGDYQPYYFLDLLDVNEGDTVEFVAKGRQCFTFYSSSVVVPEKITIIEPSGDEPLPAGEPVIVRWEGGAPCSEFRVIYYRGSDGEMFDSGMIQGSTEFTMPESWTDEGWGMIFVDGCWFGDYDDREGNDRGVRIMTQSAQWIVTGEAPSASAGLATCKPNLKHCKGVCKEWSTSSSAECAKIFVPPRNAINRFRCQIRAKGGAYGCIVGCHQCRCW